MNLSMINQARELKSKLDKAQKELKDIVIEASSGRGAVKVTIDGQQKIKSIKIDHEAINPDKVEKLEKLVQQAVSDAINKSQKTAARQLKGLTGGLKIPGLT
ncbi:YbaB/EbfC family nucleoid-associated protein [Chloroflexota bacterium]